MMSLETLLEARTVPDGNNSLAFSIPPSQVWDGNDGAWSTFVIRVGNPPQYYRVLPATSSDETWVPAPDDCDKGMAWCGNARGVEPFNAGTSGPASGSPSGLTLVSLDAGMTCTANKSPMCVNCVSIDGKCTNGPCVGRTCCGDPPGECNSGGCNGISGICTGAYIGCPCPGPDYNAASSITPAPSAANPLTARGFLANASTSWSSQGTHMIGTNLPINQTIQAQYGLDTVGLGADSSTGLTLDSSIVAGIPAVPYYLGQLGLKPSNSSGPTRGRQSLTSQLISNGLIPSSSFGYSAGALYRPGPMFGSLTLGGYDNSRLIPNDMTFAITDFNQLRIPLHAITSSGNLQNNVTLLSNNITALIDTTTPFHWLPITVCEAFEAAFGLTWDQNTSLYLVNDTIHEKLLINNPSVTFSFWGDLARPAASSLPNAPINITLPYGAFDLQASVPIYPNGTNYFPIRRATNDSQYTVGRAFFQEAYLTVDYEAGNFSVSQAKFPTTPNPDIITINHHDMTSNSSSSMSTSRHTHALSDGSIAGIVIGACAAVALLFSLLFFFLRSRRRRMTSSHSERRPSKSSLTSGETSPTATVGWPQISTLQEMSSSADTDRGQNLSAPTSPATFVSPISTYMSTMSKPLPKLPVELPGSEVANELMERSRSRDPKRGRSRSKRNTNGGNK